MKTALIYWIVLMLLASCNGQQNETAHTDHSVEAPQKYTCTMHPQIIRNNPGTCPICGMTLVKVSTSKSNYLMLSDTQMRLANVTTRRAGKSNVGETIVMNGTLVVDEQRSETVSARVAGRIEKLFVKETGRVVAKGEPLYTMYSEELLTLQQEYLLAKDQYKAFPEKRYKSFLDAAEQKLLLYGLTKKQIIELSKEDMQTGITFTSPSGGVVAEINVAEGQYVGEGVLLYTIEDMSTLWVEAELYPNEAALVKRGDKINVMSPGFEDPAIEAKVEFLSPEFRPSAQILLMRASIKNPELKFKPGQQVQVSFSHSSREGVAIPLDAVIRDGKGAHVYVQSGKNTFEPRMVKTGNEGLDQVEITEGLSEGDTVAITGAYLLYSEIILKKGTDPMAGHNH